MTKIALVFALIAGCGGPPPALEGRAVEWGTDPPVPLSGIQVLARADGAPSPEPVTTGEDGRFRLDGVAPGVTYTFTVDRPGWMVKEATGTAPEEGVADLDGNVWAHAPPGLTVTVSDCVSGARLEGVTVQSGDRKAATDTDGIAVLDELGQPGTVGYQVFRPGLSAVDTTTILRGDPPFSTRVAHALCPDLPDDPGPLLIPSGPGTLASVPATSVVSAHKGRPHFTSDQLALNAEGYTIDENTPVIPLEELEAAPAFAGGRMLVRTDGLHAKVANVHLGWRAGKVYAVTDLADVEALPWAVGGQWTMPKEPVHTRPGGYIGVRAFKYRPTDSGLYVLSKWTRAVEWKLDQPAPEGYSVVQVPPGLWAFVDAQVPKPWPIYVLRVNEAANP